MSERPWKQDILTTKLYPPPLRPDGVSRPRLLDALQAGMKQKWTLVSAPAGSGKTTLVREGVESTTLPFVWLSLESRDDEPIRFWSHWIASLQTLCKDWGSAAQEQLTQAHFSTTAWVTSVLNELASSSMEFIWVIDDLHVLQDTSILETLCFVIEHAPHTVHFVVITREDPPFPLARFRARGQLTEIRAEALRFTPDESRDFFQHSMQLDVSDEDVAIVAASTEGWAVGLQLAGLFLRGSLDHSKRLQAFGGGHRYILDYLVEEVLQQQAEDVRLFLLQTSILERFNASLCSAVTGQSDCRSTLSEFERKNIFLVPLDEQRQWFRYHHLFAEFLQICAQQEPKIEPEMLHQRACRWLEKEGFTEEALYHALLGQEHTVATRLLECIWPKMDHLFRSATWLTWIQQLPKEALLHRPVLCAAYAWAFLNEGYLNEAKDWLKHVESLLSEQEGDPVHATLCIEDEEQYAYLPASLQTAYAYYEQALGNRGRSVEHAQNALQLLATDDHVRRAPVLGLLGLAFWAEGQLEQAHQSIAEAMHAFRVVGAIQLAISGTYGLADIRLEQVRLNDAIHIYETVLESIPEQESQRLKGTTEIYLGLAELHCERGELETAQIWFARALELGEDAALLGWKERLFRTRARLEESSGLLTEAVHALEQAEAFHQTTPLPQTRPLAAWKARLWLKQGQLSTAIEWMKSTYEHLDTSSYLHAFERITCLKIQLAADVEKHSEASINALFEAVQSMLDHALQHKHQHNALELYILQARLLGLQQDELHLVQVLESAFECAAPESYMQIFIDEGPAFFALLKTYVHRSQKHVDFVQHVAHLFIERYPDLQYRTFTVQEKPSNLPSTMPTLPLGIEPLSRRETEVLQLVAEGYSNREIGLKLHVSLSTIKGHNRNIFEKLNVRRRTEAVACARKWGMLKSSSLQNEQGS